MDYAREHIYSTLYLCWSAMAATYYFYNIEKYSYPTKLCGIFPLRNVQGDANTFSRGMDDEVHICQSRYTGIDQIAFQQQVEAEKLVSLFTSTEQPTALQGSAIGVSAFAEEDKSALYNLGHFEYHEGTIDQEIQRDSQKNPPLYYPVEHYYADPERKIGLPPMTWKASQTLFYSNFLNVIYQRMNEKTMKRVPFILRTS
jgi:homoserine O-succinyltransferase